MVLAAIPNKCGDYIIIEYNGQMTLGWIDRHKIINMSGINP